MPRSTATRHNRPTRTCVGPDRGRVSRPVVSARALARSAVFLLSISLPILPLVHAQHASGGGSHPSPPPRQSAPRSSAPPAPAPRPSYRAAPPGYAPRPGAPYASAPYANSRGQHLGNWLQSHQGESFVGQENALRREPGFNRLPQQQQQRLVDRLHQLDTMPPQQRQRTLGRVENMERLSPERRQAVRGSAQELSNMDPARKQQVRGAFRTLRDIPPGQRQQVLNSPAYRSMYSEHERQVLSNLLSVEPYTPH
jgi:hypothetical protein